MVPLTELWVPILLSAVLVFVVSAVFHMALPLHRQDFRRLPREDEAMEALRRFDIPPGDYMVPCPEGPHAMKSPEFLEKYRKGPVAVMTVMPGGTLSLAPSLAGWFVYCVVVNLFAGYVASRALGPGANYMDVFRFVGTVAFAGYSLAMWQQTIWYKKALRTTLLYTAEGLAYALLAAGVFGWLWPR
jgi:hypothetical protein